MQVQNKKSLTRKLTGLCTMIITTAALFSCSKSGTTVAPPTVTVGQFVHAGTIGSPNTTTAIKGVMGDSVYTIAGDIIINAGDTLTINPGAQIIFKGAYNIFVRGQLFSLGSKTQPILMTAIDPKTGKIAVKQDNPSTPIATDPAFQGLWGGIWCDTSCQNLVLKWTNLQFGGAPIAAAQPPIAGASTGDSYDIFFQNTHGNFIMEDSWLYGGTDDAIRLKNGQFSVMRNTFEKGGGTGGDFFNVKGSSRGDCAFNLFIGCACNGPKASSAKLKAGDPEANCDFYNNTVVNSGYRMVEIGRGGSINYEEHAQGMAYNNLIVNCRFGFRIVGATQSYLGNALVVADTAHIQYGYTYNYQDSASATAVGQGVIGVGVEQFYPVTPDTSATKIEAAPITGMWARPQSTDIPNMTALMPLGYYPGMPYGSAAVTALAGKNNPMFVNFPLPEAAQPSTIAYATGFDFHLQAGSPAIGKGNTNFSPLKIVPQGGQYGANESGPGADIGAYQSTNPSLGNQH